MEEDPDGGGAGEAGVTFVKTHDIAGIGPGMEGSRVVACGWVEDVRRMGKMSFITLRDVTGIAQVVVKGELNGSVGGISRQSSVSVEGTVRGTRARDFGFEIAADRIEVLGRAVHPLPVDPIGRQGSNLDTRLNHRALDMRNQRTASVFKVRHHVLQAVRADLAGRGFIEITTPKIIGSASEGGADLFSLEYFGKRAYLAQSPQLYKEQMTLGLERVFEVSSFYRAEKSHTGRHLSEFTSVDIEAAFMDYGDVMGILESLVAGVYARVAGSCGAEMAAIGREVEVPGVPFERVTYAECVAELREAGQEVGEGGDLLDSHLRIIGEGRPGFYFITDWPLGLKPFYIRGKEGGGGLSRSFDLQHGHLELSSGGTRLHDAGELGERLRAQGLDPAQFGGHLAAFEWGMPPHAGWGLGLDRLVAALVGADNVREVVLYPRDPDRLSP